MTNPSTNAPKTLVLKIIWGALLFSQALYVVVLHVQLKPLDDMPMNTQWMPNLQDPMEIGLFAASVALLVASFLVPQILAKASEQKPRADADPSKTDTVPQAFFVPFIIRLALLEAICMQGFVLAFIKRSPNLILPFITISGLLFLKNFPSNAEKVKSDLLG